MTIEAEDTLAPTPLTRDSEDFRRNLANPTRFPTDAEWELMTPIEQASFIMGMEDG